jgi:hypothetical protein
MSCSVFDCIQPPKHHDVSAFIPPFEIGSYTLCATHYVIWLQVRLIAMAVFQDKRNTPITDLLISAWEDYAIFRNNHMSVVSPFGGEVDAEIL